MRSATAPDAASGGRLIVGRALRLVAAALAFAVFGVGSLLLGIVVFPLLRINADRADTMERRCRYAIHLAFRVFVALLVFLRLIRLRMRGEERLREAKGCLVVANHPSLIDAVILIAQLRGACCVVKEGVWRSPFFGRVVRAAGYIPSQRADLVVAGVVERLQAGQTVVLFPEGTRTPRNALPRVRRGAILALLRANRPVLPVFLHVAPRALCKGDSLADLPRRVVTFSVDVGTVVEASAFADVVASERAAARHGAEHLEELFRQQAQNVVR